MCLEASGRMPIFGKGQRTFKRASFFPWQRLLLLSANFANTESGSALEKEGKFVRKAAAEMESFRSKTS